MLLQRVGQGQLRADAVRVGTDVGGKQKPLMTVNEIDQRADLAAWTSFQDAVRRRLAIVHYKIPPQGRPLRRISWSRNFRRETRRRLPSFEYHSAVSDRITVTPTASLRLRKLALALR